MTINTLSIIFIAVALGMDAFSLGIGLGMKKLKNREILKVSLTIGIFHVLMPLIGISLGHSLHFMLGDILKKIGASVLMGFGLMMIYQTLLGNHKGPVIHTNGWGLIVFAISVSIDALSVGLGLGALQVPVWLSVILFGGFGFLLSAIGILIGQKISTLFGNYAEILGGIILLAFGLKWF